MPLAESLALASLILTAVGTTATVTMAVTRMRRHRKPRLRTRPSRPRTPSRDRLLARPGSHPGLSGIQTRPR